MINDNEFLLIIDDLLKNNLVDQMKKYRQHYDVTTFEHCLNVSYISYKICKKLKLDYVSMARGALLHDLFLYDWRVKRGQCKFKDLHAFSHPKIALKNAKKIIKLNEIEENIILSHMWPISFNMPKYPESYIITLVDKYSAIMEGIRFFKKKYSKEAYYEFFYRLSNFIKNSNYQI